VINPAGRGIIVPEYTITDRAGGSEIVADYGSAGHLRLTVAIVDLSECESPDSGVANSRLVRLEPRPYRDNKPQCRRVSLEVEPGLGIDESALRSKLFRVWLTAGHTIGTVNGDIAVPVERRIDLSRPQ
jgi:hypothetical protein